MKQNITLQSASQLPIGDSSPEHDPMAGRSLSYRVLCNLAIQCQREAAVSVADRDARRTLAARYFAFGVASLMYAEGADWEYHDEFLRCLGFDDYCEVQS